MRGQVREEEEAESRNPPERIARQRLRVLELAEGLQNVSAACRERGLTRTQCYDDKRRFEYKRRFEL